MLAFGKSLAYGFYKSLYYGGRVGLGKAGGKG
jgi:hypothetical protein